MDRIDYFNFHDIFNARKSTGYRILDDILNLQKKLKWNRKYPAEFRDLKLYGGSTYWSLSREVLQYVVEFTKEKPSFLKRFAHTFCAEEIYFQTIILQSPYAASIINDNLRYIDWQAGPQRHPMYLIEDDYEKLISSNKLFARKIDNKQSRGLRTMLANHFRKGGTVNV
jgi:hypothetical protein